MQQSEILSIAERLIPVYNTVEYDFLLSQMTEGEPPSAKILVKMELNRIMAPCTKTIDLRGRVQGECREYELDGLKHWLDDVAFNVYHKNTRKFQGYTEGVWLALCNTRNNFRVMQQRGNYRPQELTNADSPFEVEPVTLGYDLKRKENRLKISSQVEVFLANDQLVHAVTVDLSSSGGRFKVPAAFNYKLGEVISVTFVEIAKDSEIDDIDDSIQYRIVGIDDSYENDAVKYLRTIKLSDSKVVESIIEQSLIDGTQKARHDNQDKIIRARTRGFEHTYLKHTCNLPVFFSGNELKLVLMTENNQQIWQYWHDERNQQTLGSLFNQERMNLLTRPGMKGCNNVLYSFSHGHQDKTLFFSMMMPEASREERQLFWHIGAKKSTWKAFRLSVFELSDQEREELSQHSTELTLDTNTLTHCGILQEIADTSAARDYLLTEKPRLPSKELNKFRHARNVAHQPVSLYFDAQSRRKEARYQFRSPITVTCGKQSAEGVTLDISKRGLNLALSAPLDIKAEEFCQLNFKELQLYDKSEPLTQIPYQVIRVSAGGKRLQLMLEDNPDTAKTASFLKRLIDHNLDKLTPNKELLPTNQLLESLHDILLDKMVSTPIFVTKKGPNLTPSVIGVNYPLHPYLTLFAKLGHEQHFSLEPIYKGRTNTLLAAPMKRIEGARPQYHELYVSVISFAGRIQSIDTKLSSEFENVQERINYIKKTQSIGEFFALRICGVPVFEPFTTLLRKDLNELTQISMHQARGLEKEISTIAGYGELIDISEEVLVRLELTR